MDRLSPGDELILSLSREGKSDAEIAVRLGLNVGQVRERRGRILAAATVSPGEPLTAPAAPSRRRAPPRWLLIAAGVFAAAWVSFALYLEFGGSGTPNTALADPAPTSLGRVVLTPRGEAIEIDERAAFTVLTVPDGTVIQNFDPNSWSESWGQQYGGLVLTGNVDGTWVHVAFAPLRDANIIRQLNGGVKVVGSGAGGPAIIRVMAAGYNGRDLRAVTADASGKLFVARQGIAPELAIDASTGAALDVSHATRLGNATTGASPLLSPGDIATAQARGVSVQGEVFNSCATQAASICSTMWFAAVPLMAPFDGVAACSPEGALTLTGRQPGYTLVIESPAQTPVCTEDTGLPKPVLGPVAAGQYLLMPSIYHLSATDSRGHPVGVAIARDGTVYIGDIRTTADCPCATFN